MAKFSNTHSISSRYLLYTLLCIAMLLPSACSKDHLFDFTKSTGPQVIIERNVDKNFDRIFMKDNINVVLTKGPVYNLKLEGGENLLPGIETEVKDNMLIISNKNTYNWVRSYDKELTVYVTMPHIWDIQYESVGTLTNTDTIQEDSLFVQVNGGSGFIDLAVKTGMIKLSIVSGSADLKVSGESGMSFLYLGSMGAIRTFDLRSKIVFMENAGTNNCFVNVRDHFEYIISGIGDIHYKGHPVIMNGNITGKGKLINAN